MPAVPSRVLGKLRVPGPFAEGPPRSNPPREDIIRRCVHGPCQWHCEAHSDKSSQRWDWSFQGQPLTFQSKRGCGDFHQNRSRKNIGEPSLDQLYPRHRIAPKSWVAASPAPIGRVLLFAERSVFVAQCWRMRRCLLDERHWAGSRVVVVMGPPSRRQCCEFCHERYAPSFHVTVQRWFPSDPRQSHRSNCCESKSHKDDNGPKEIARECSRC
mmetsp:Transcript_7037/g.14434  ORF Transcript_7037/g.14434 Transcript_7037/m.14434 type:complete len:213 (+) Transcript_7037:247-885(+)